MPLTQRDRDRIEDLGLDSEADQTPDLRPEKELPPTSTAKHRVEGIQPIPTRGADL
ncbi:Uncharacterised protein [Mycobacteroides abscessus subsp. abscessus]|uniref:hypothetical protein n=1 Tax=Mycobacteroides abscessus TaxID=36809 RepID=UPI0002683ECA|nr:hypothetical protein [Mycobacteroides abscessus]EIV26961.1 hypothetical protein MA3A0119R_1680 [Mycobacteroides abscessus 3A-0119-R]EIV33884.1 hypothetical protein MA3A0122R_1732 [Mycobacteroides abscessus 3A-0122-R]EIV39385.1 hypothetical protein MA3A0122S_1249 [Mycobacteroides abscessus 3A-0122-S]EIV41027.1 hypothetical protein MA3A0731_1644 [Mycobacteroides abscessus 3A-0731]EIV55462.1 hypothetical protein MA3A0930S_1329 [Mycobacteroides abscessus 3A-0930-S]EIV56695.1 hypothetical prote